MAKRTGLGDRFLVGEYDLSGDIGAVQSIRASRAVQDVTGIDKSAFERLLGLADGEVSFSGYWNPAAAQLHPVVSDLADSTRVVSYLHGTSRGDGAAAVVGKVVTYDVSRSTEGAMAVASQVMAAAGTPLEWGVQLTAGKETFASSGTAAPVDHGAATAFGAAAYLHVISIASGTATVVVRHSSDDSSYSNLLSFTAASAATSERLATGLTTTVNRYVALNITGTFTNLVCAVVFVRYPSAQT